MTKSQYRVYNRLRKKQVNRDVTVVEASEQYVTFHVPFPGLYLTYDTVGKLLQSETQAERQAGTKPLFKPGQKPVVTGEMGSDLLGVNDNRPPWEPIDDDDDSVPF